MNNIANVDATLSEEARAYINHDEVSVHKGDDVVVMTWNEYDRLVRLMDTGSLDMTELADAHGVNDSLIGEVFSHGIRVTGKVGDTTSKVYLSWKEVNRMETVVSEYRAVSEQNGRRIA